MSFSIQTKNELARVFPEKTCCQLAELAALVRLDGSIQINPNQKLSLQVYSESAATARKILRLTKSVFEVYTEIRVQRKFRLRKNNVYLVRIPPQSSVREIIKDLGLIDDTMMIQPGISEYLIKKYCCKRSYLRGVFLGSGSVNDPEGTYHLEMITSDEIYAQAIVDLINTFQLNAKVSLRKNWWVIYLKESDQIVEFLNIIGAHTALLNFENVRIVKGMRNQVNRLVNCETANLNKTVNAALRQVENIKLIAETTGLDRLPVRLREIAELRIKHPDISLKELGEMLEPAVGKSGVNHRMRRLDEIAEQIKNK